MGADSLVLRALQSDHDRYRRTLALAEALVDRLEGGAALLGTREVNELRSFVDCLVGDVDRHAREEAETLYLVLGRRLHRVSGPLINLEGDHDQVRRLTRVLTEELERSIPDVKLVNETARTIIRILRDHFEYEEIVVFPMARRLFDPEDLRELMTLWGDTRSRRSQYEDAHAVNS